MSPREQKGSVTLHAIDVEGQQPRHVKVCEVAPAPKEALLELLADPEIASKHWIIRQYDHEVQGNLALKPLVGAEGVGPGDAAVIEPVAGTGRGLAVGCGLVTGVGDVTRGGDPYLMALASIDECVRNLVCVGADPDRIAILDNFCWPSCARSENLGSLVRAAEGCYDGAKAYRTPFVSGKDSLNNQFTSEDGRTIEIPPTLLITGIGVVHDLGRVRTMDLKSPGNLLVYVQPRGEEGFANEYRMGGSRFAHRFGVPPGSSGNVPRVDLDEGPRVARHVARLMREGLVESAHDVSDGGLACALAEMLIAGSSPTRRLGIDVRARLGRLNHLFAEAPCTYVLEVKPANLLSVAGDEVNLVKLGVVNDSGTLEIRSGDEAYTVGVDELTMAWRGTLDW